MTKKMKDNTGNISVEMLVFGGLIFILIALLVTISVILVKNKTVSEEKISTPVTKVNTPSEVAKPEDVKPAEETYENINQTPQTEIEDTFTQTEDIQVENIPLAKNDKKKENLPDIKLYCPQKLNEIAKMFDILVYKNTAKFLGTYTNCLLSDDKTSLTVCGKSAGSNQDLCYNYSLKDSGWISSACFFSSPQSCNPSYRGEHYDCKIIDKKNYICKYCQGNGVNSCFTSLFTVEVSNVAKNYFLEKRCEKPNSADNTCSKYRSITLYKKRPDGTFKSVGCTSGAISGNTCHHYNMFCRENGSCFQPGQWQKYQGNYVKSFLQ